MTCFGFVGFVVAQQTSAGLSVGSGAAVSAGGKRGAGAAILTPRSPSR